MNKLYNTRFFLTLILLLLCINACKQSNRPNTNGIKIDLNIERFDHDLYKGKSIGEKAIIPELEKKYNYFFKDYIRYIVGNNDLSADTIIGALYADKAYTDLQKETDSIFPNLKPYQSGLLESFKNIKYYNPKAPIPTIITYISGFSFQNTIGEDYLGISLDMFLGKNSKFYAGIVESVPRYLSNRFTPEYLVPRTIETYTRENLYPEPDNSRSLLSKMIHNGKILYYLDNVLPEKVADSIKIGYTDKQLRWCKTFEKEIWGYFLENNLLYETNYQKIQVYLNDGPFTPGLGEKRESAPKIGVFTGWQIVKSYMQNNPGITLQQLMDEQDAQRILNKSKYKP